MRNAASIFFAASAASASSWPACQNHKKVIRYNHQNALFTDLAGYGAISGCFLDDCATTDKFSATQIESCAQVCHTIEACQFWIWGTEEGTTKCWFRTSADNVQDGDGFIYGDRDCSPPDTKALVKGNVDCWVEGFDYSTCCEDHYGPNGNAQCWDGLFNYNKCCFPKTELWEKRATILFFNWGDQSASRVCHYTVYAIKKRRNFLIIVYGIRGVPGTKKNLETKEE